MQRSKEVRIAYLRPREIAARLRKAPVVFVPFGPLEWHGPHMPYGTDALNAEATALAVAAKTGGLVWPTQFWGTERERRPEQLRSLGFPATKYVVGMDFPRNIIPSSYCPEEVLALLAREILTEVMNLGAKLAVIVNGHGAENQIATLQRLAIEFTNETPLEVHFRIAAPMQAITVGSGGHADAGETSLMMHLHGNCVDLKELPPKSRRMKYTNYAVVDGPGFDSRPGNTGYLGRKDDPRFAASARLGHKGHALAVKEIAAEVKKLLKSKR